MRFLYKPITNLRKFSKKSRNLSDIKFIIIHDTGNPSKGADAMMHFKYLQQAKRYGSAHYYVDDKEIIQTIGDSKVAWAVGDTWAKKHRTRSDVYNRNSISVELCINSDIDEYQAYVNLLELTKNLMKKFKINAEHVVRHFDATGKPCPGSWKKDNWAKWKQFKHDILQPIVYEIDLDKDCEFGKHINMEEKEYFETNGLKVIKTSSDKIYIQQLGGKTLRQIGAYGINGTFFDTNKPELAESTWGIAINKGKPIGANASINHWKSNIKRGTLIYGEGKLTVERINNISEVKRKVIWAIGGVGLYPSYDPEVEKVPKDILRCSAHTGIAFKGDVIYLVVTENPCTMGNFRTKMINLGIDGAIALDGGGSTQMLYKNNFGIHAARKLNNIVGIKGVR